jgi:hypothetical protein
LFLLSGVLSMALPVSCGLADERIVAGTPAGDVAVPKDDPVPALDALKPGRAVLVEGSAPVKGLPGFGRNALSALYGKYAYPQGSDVPPLEVSVWFTREILVMPATWGKGACRTVPPGFSMLAAPPEADGSVLWSLAGIEYTLFVRIPAGMADPCAFIAVFADRFSFFYRYTTRPEDVSFPAILEL